MTDMTTQYFPNQPTEHKLVAYCSFIYHMTALPLRSNRNNKNCK